MAQSVALLTLAPAAQATLPIGMIARRGGLRQYQEEATAMLFSESAPGAGARRLPRYPL